MPFIRSTLGVALLATAASAQVASLSSACQAAALGLVGGDFATCVNLTPLVSALAGSGSLVPQVNTWLSGACQQTCSAATLANATSTIRSGCASDISSGSAIATGLVTLTTNYTEVKNFLCLGASSNNTFCLTNLLTSVQNATGTDLDSSAITGLLSGGSSALSSFASKIPASALCTDCFHAEISALTSLSSAITGTSSAVDSGLSGISQTCGAEFTDGKTPASVTQLTSGAAGASGTTSANAGSVSSTTLGGRAGRGYEVSTGAMMGAVSAVAMVLAGGWTTLA